MGQAPLPVVGLDCEWRRPGRGGRIAGVDVVQLAPTPSLAGAAVFRCEGCRVPAPLAALLEDPSVLKVVFGVMDAKVLWLSGVRLRGAMDLQRTARMLQGDDAGGLAAMYRGLCGKELAKEQQVSDWGAEELSLAQVQYAAQDAVATLEVLHALRDGWMPGAPTAGGFARFFVDALHVDESGDLQRAGLPAARAQVLAHADLPERVRRALLAGGPSGGAPSGGALSGPRAGGDSTGSGGSRAQRPGAAKRKFYAVAVGRAPGVYETWEECKGHCLGFPGASYKSFGSREEAEAFVAAARSESATGSPPW